ncbi:MAG: M28 family peptidase [Candidatus Bathyarchaeota archaeon]|nr:M28 family peptidase [Candidatus Bathyarchaeota archaeon]
MARRSQIYLVLVLIIISVAALVYYDQYVHRSTTTSPSNLKPVEQQVTSLVNGSRVYDLILELENISLRHPSFISAGSAGANETAYWIKEKFESFGLEAWLEPFTFTGWDLPEKPSLVIDEDGSNYTVNDQVVVGSFQCEHYSWPTSGEGVFADLVVLPLPVATKRSEIGVNPIDFASWNAKNTTGKIVLVGREISWSRTWQQVLVSKLSQEPPASVVYTWWYDWMSFTPPLYSSAGGLPLGELNSYYWDLEIPVGFVNYEDGLWIRSRENASARVIVKSVISSDATHFNVVARLAGNANPEKTVIISSHYDTVMTSGFADNCAGTAGILELANVLHEAAESGVYKPNCTLLFVAFSAEELYLVGSANYVRQHKNEMVNTSAVINLDCIGNERLSVSTTSEGKLEQTIQEAAQALGISISAQPESDSDHEAFRIPLNINTVIFSNWKVDLGISDAEPVSSSVMLFSHPLLYSDLWETGTAGWIHTSYDNSTSTATLGWVKADNLGNHIKTVALAIMRISTDATL